MYLFGLFSGVLASFLLLVGFVYWDDRCRKNAKLKREAAFHLQNPKLGALEIPETGREFELWVGGQLEELGWNVEVTPESGDKGVDVLCEKDGVKLAVQCKRYTRPIGVSAVQEVFSGGSFYSVPHQAVVSTSSFTRQSQDLAKKKGVRLIYATDLQKISPEYYS